MNIIKRLKITILGLSIIFGASSAMAFGQWGSNSNAGRSFRSPAAFVAQLPFEELNEAEKTGLLKMREEEKLARDVYLYLYDLWENPIFSRIANSEQRHMDAVGALLEKYNMTDPILGSERGFFTDTALQNLYNSLIEKGTISLEEALTVGATIEDLDIKDLQDLIAQTDNEDILTIYQNLMKGSRNHLRAFCQGLSVINISYEAQFLSQDEVNSIIHSAWERGRVDKEGHLISGGQGHGGAYGSCTGSCGTDFIDQNGDRICDNLQ